MARTFRAGDTVEDVCRACKTDRLHTVVAADPSGHPIRVVCDYCRSEHNYRGRPSMDLAGALRPRLPCRRLVPRATAAQTLCPS